MKGFHCLNIPSSWSLSLLNPQCFFVWVLLCAPLIMKCKSFLHQTMGQRGVWPHGIALYQKTSSQFLVVLILRFHRSMNKQLIKQIPLKTTIHKHIIRHKPLSVLKRYSAFCVRLYVTFYVNCDASENSSQNKNNIQEFIIHTLVHCTPHFHTIWYVHR